ncbi:TraR/DksA C4-type zinc finger protein [Alicyclobacillus tolerans]|uniref:Transcriptional regulator, TraR/DksA family n=1 Tax=Alicyclobacillus tolerans TaxID=90970 RepID=A0A1M6Q659_9BACL|nr:TraR/DksA C4-type zinc finger protein [Alicyclobacillus montanus]SHK15586.1 transcriptional regulator, TraR/DksA family [Alicyclobacillus montanus]
MDREKARQRLLALKESLEGRAEYPNQNRLNDSQRDETSELSMIDNHPADAATELLDREMALGMRAANSEYALQIERALHAIENGEYGQCAICQQEIPEERLEAYPLALTCIQCQERIDHLDHRRTRPIEEEVFPHSFGSLIGDDKDTTGFDGEDSWQAVGQMNARPSANDPESIGYETWLEGIGPELTDGITNEEWRDTLSR